VLTTNEPDALDPAVARPGRIDLREHLGLADAGQAARIVSRWYGTPLAAADMPGARGIAPALVIETCKQHDDVTGAVGALTALAARPVAA
jgi:ATP-dependent 26S proteasome regulatory subunit